MDCGPFYYFAAAASITFGYASITCPISRGQTC
jgi:hypothetical protein